MFKTFADAVIIHEKFIFVSNEGKNYRRLMDSIRTKNNQRGDIERDKSTEHIKRISLNEILRQNE